jgi:hypothetical protein
MPHVSAVVDVLVFPWPWIPPLLLPQNPPLKCPSFKVVVVLQWMYDIPTFYV